MLEVIRLFCFCLCSRLVRFFFIFFLLYLCHLLWYSHLMNDGNWKSSLLSKVFGALNRLHFTYITHTTETHRIYGCSFHNFEFPKGKLDCYTNTKCVRARVYAKSHHSFFLCWGLRKLICFVELISSFRLVGTM